MKSTFTKHGLPAFLLTLLTLPGAADTPLPGLSAQISPKQALEEARAATSKGELSKAAEILKAAAEKGDAVAAIAYGELLVAGRGVKASGTEALTWFERAAERGNALGKFRQAQIYLTGVEGVPKDEDRAQFLINAAATEGQPDAQHALGTMEDAAGRKADAANEREKHFAAALGWFEKAVAQNHPQAMYSMARYMDQGLGGAPKDPAKAMENCFKAAQTGLLSAITDMGQRYLQGRGIRPDNVAALGWFLVAAEGGSADGMVRLGQAYENGSGVPPNPNTAGSWYARAAKTGYPPANYMLARLQEEGRGVEKNLVLAYTNYVVAANNGMSEAGVRRDALKAILSPDQLKEVEKLASPK